MNNRELLNEIYKPLHNVACDVSSALLDNGYVVKLGYYNLHEVKVGGDYETEFFPLPEIEIESSANYCDLGFSLDGSAWLELTFEKEFAEKINYVALRKETAFSVYGASDYLIDLYGGEGDVSDLADKVEEAFEDEIHLFFDIKQPKIKVILNLLEVLKDNKILE